METSELEEFAQKVFRIAFRMGEERGIALRENPKLTPFQKAALKRATSNEIETEMRFCLKTLLSEKKEQPILLEQVVELPRPYLVS